MIEVYHAGTLVQVGEVPGTITAVTLRSGHIEYQVAYWDGGHLVFDWVPSWMIKSDKKREWKIGFREGSQEDNP